MIIIMIKDTVFYSIIIHLFFLTSLDSCLAYNVAILVFDTYEKYLLRISAYLESNSLSA